MLRTKARTKKTVAQGALAQAVQEHREWVKFHNMTQEVRMGLQSLRKRVYCPIPIISLPLLLPWVPEPEFALLAQELELGLSGGASQILQILQVESQASEVDTHKSLTRQYQPV